jgi:hypothetical protein
VIEPEHETARPSTGPGFGDAVTYGWGDRSNRLYGAARIGLAGDDARVASALAVLFAGSEPIAATARDDVEVPSDADFADLAAGGLRTTVVAPLREWTIAYEAGESGFDLTFAALAPPAEIDRAEPVARTGGMVGYEQLCRVRGTVRVRGEQRSVETLGQRGHTWGEPDWERIDSARTLNAWLDDGTGVTITTVRPAGRTGPDRDAAWGVVLDPAGSLHVDEARISTTYDGDGRQRRAGLELWLGEDEGFARRAAGEVLAGSTFELGELRLDLAFFAWHMHGRHGVGRYDVVRRA